MISGGAFRALLESGDVTGLQSAWANHYPRLPRPRTREQTEIVMHYARTEADSVSFRARAYSHAWLSERSLPSGLPDQLRASADRLYPRVAAAVGISVNAKSPELQPALDGVRVAMERAVLDAEAEGRLTDSPFVVARMGEARRRELRALFGRIGPAAPPPPPASRLA